VTRLEYIMLVLAESLDKGTIGGKDAARVLRWCGNVTSVQTEPENDPDLARAHEYVSRLHKHLLGKTRRSGGFTRFDPPELK
jgi:hypothetical protein